MLALHQIRSARQVGRGAPRSPTAPATAGFSSPQDHARFARGMTSKGSTPEGIAWFLGGDP